MLKGKNILLGVTGGIAVYKVADLVSRLRKQNANVEVIMTDAAMEFVNPMTFQTMSNRPVHTDMFNKIHVYDVEHISLAQKADIILVAPATANTIGKIANGMADNLLTTVIMASKSKLIFAPAMNTDMYNNPIVQENIRKLESLGSKFIPPGIGLLACGDYGAGKMAEPEDIVEYVRSSLVEKDLLNKKIVITAGPTIEYLDPIRYISNHSSGKMGYALAKKASERGAKTILISGPTSLTPPIGVEVVNVNTTEEMFKAVGIYFDECDALIKAAAPSDYKPSKVEENKIKKKEQEDEELNIKFMKNTDIVKYYGNLKEDQIVVGFAAETENLLDNAMEKIEKKNLDFIVANDITKKGAGFNKDTNIVNIIDRNTNIDKYPIMSKEKVANIIIDKIISTIDNKS
ncbi:MAG TPA: bifunctional phosphopantothenoylcysteine decarboxylase/phosphopantothenate--cysteine ligase CoaBC [Tissierellaceae bacterium]|nr:bifunctional phosphopantothenoylcysteine decarboxylase/phosphopantothenate--cysteine ligase CoaBC [Tissierellaceae bacterium]